MKNCRTVYLPGSDICIDESMASFHGRTILRQFVSLKPCRYGIKIWSLADVQSHYVYNCEIYEGKRLEPQKGLAQQVVTRLLQPLMGSGRTLTADNFFSSIDLVKDLYSKHIFYVGTVRKNARMLPAEFTVEKVAEGHSKFVYSGECTLVKYQAKKNKAVMMISTKHYQPVVEQSRGRGGVMKPGVIIDYNHCKSGVDTVDQMLESKSCKFPTRR
jgi:hypothetical protein